MATLIDLYTSDGCEGWCDARCYGEAVPRNIADPASECDCIYGGMNHGASVQQAVDNTCRLAEPWVEADVRDRPLADALIEDAVRLATAEAPRLLARRD